MSKLDRRLVGGTYFTALDFGLVKEPDGPTFILPSVADEIEEKIDAEIKRREAAKRLIADIMKVVPKAEDAKNENPGQ